MDGFLDLSGKRALATAGTKGAGAATVDLFRALGALKRHPLPNDVVGWSAGPDRVTNPVRSS